MRIVATRDEVEGLPAWAKEFVAVAWGAPDEDGMRKVKPVFEDMTRIGAKVASEMEKGLNQPDALRRHFGFAVEDPGGRFTQADFWLHRDLETIFEFLKAWNSRADIGVCQVCGSIHLPAKGRAARFCSPACRLKAHRERNAAAQLAAQSTMKATATKKGAK